MAVAVTAVAVTAVAVMLMPVLVFVLVLLVMMFVLALLVLMFVGAEKGTSENVRDSHFCAPLIVHLGTFPSSSSVGDKPVRRQPGNFLP